MFLSSRFKKTAGHIHMYDAYGAQCEKSALLPGWKATTRPKTSRPTTIIFPADRAAAAALPDERVCNDYYFRSENACQPKVRERPTASKTARVTKLPFCHQGPKRPSTGPETVRGWVKKNRVVDYYRGPFSKMAANDRRIAGTIPSLPSRRGYMNRRLELNTMVDGSRRYNQNFPRLHSPGSTLWWCVSLPPAPRAKCVCRMKKQPFLPGKNCPVAFSVFPSRASLPQTTQIRGRVA